MLLLFDDNSLSLFALFSLYNKLICLDIFNFYMMTQRNVLFIFVFVILVSWSSKQQRAFLLVFQRAKFCEKSLKSISLEYFYFEKKLLGKNGEFQLSKKTISADYSSFFSALKNSLKSLIQFFVFAKENKKQKVPSREENVLKHNFARHTKLDRCVLRPKWERERIGNCALHSCFLTSCRCERVTTRPTPTSRLHLEEIRFFFSSPCI